MAVKHAFNASVAKLQHEMWKNKIITFLNGGPVPTEVSHRECQLGKWLYEEGGKEEYGSLPEMRHLEKEHTKFHDVIKQAIAMQQAGNEKEAWNLYESLKPLSKELLAIIDTLSNKLKQNKAS
ncbi:hypothetical protein TI05_01395 [Achromatium sp. WMS3]|nr:hypothetical protein TI05_01395 [Achromatium sp. WMS3]